MLASQGDSVLCESNREFAAPHGDLCCKYLDDCFFLKSVFTLYVCIFNRGCLCADVS